MYILRDWNRSHWNLKGLEPWMLFTPSQGKPHGTIADDDLR
ncbi:MAG TPA: hypothetical protein VHA56_14335 [Mucilaginibacter sp.]|nr:hypothetical protein [Mucilaginibacter sp.]